jgi:Pentapeptide repeats (9 copies)
VRVSFQGRARPVADQKSAKPQDAGEARLWRIGIALAVSFTVAVLGLTGFGYLAWLLLGLAGFRRHGPPSLHDTVTVIQLVFASVAGAGALVALVVAYRRQKVSEADSAHDRTRVFNERFSTIATQLGEASHAVRLAGVHAMAGLADDWKANRQTCIDVLCAYLRMPYEPDPGIKAPGGERLIFRANREVRITAIRVIAAHLKHGAAVPWRGYNFDFTGAAFDGGSFEGAVFSGGTVSFEGAVFSGGTVSFEGAVFSGGTVDFVDSLFSGGTVDFSAAEFVGKMVNFGAARFLDGAVSFRHTVFSGGIVAFNASVFSGATVDFNGGLFTRGEVNFDAAEFADGSVDFFGAEFSGAVVDLRAAKFSGCSIDFSGSGNWSNPPNFISAPPASVKLPPAAHRPE